MIDVIRILLPAVVAFIVGIALSPVVTHYLYKYKAWKKHGGKRALDGTEATEFARLHKATETKTPRMGGIVIWGSLALTAAAFWLVSMLAPSTTTESLNFINRNQTWIPLMTLLVGAFVGLVNDILDVVDKPQPLGLPLSVRLAIITLLSLGIGWWFYTKLGITSIGIPFLEPLHLGVFIVPLFIGTTLFVYASGVIDGIDGLSGGVFASIFSGYAFIAFANGQYDLAAFCAALVGALLAFLWFNVPPARYWMTETGTMSLTLTLAAIAFLTDLKGEGNGIAVLPVIGFLLVATVASNVLQIGWKRFFKRKLFRIAPLHHHFEAIGWSQPKVTMRYWILSLILCISGVTLALLG
ncbi:hypothetical protein KGO06_00525 [Patescibacteria group bacterium]|nr:hypothetical protein [Patescibacteria group bacterium]